MIVNNLGGGGENGFYFFLRLVTLGLAAALVLRLVRVPDTAVLHTALFTRLITASALAAVWLPFLTASAL
jgi:hypothetical protein